jgi:hypothetical protein
LRKINIRHMLMPYPLQVARSLALHHTLIPIHTHMSTSIHTHTHTIRLTRIPTNTCIYLTHLTSMPVSSSLLFLVCLVFVHKARAMARFLFLASGLYFNLSSWKERPMPVSVPGQRKPEAIPVKLQVPRLDQTHYLQVRIAQASLLSK